MERLTGDEVRESYLRWFEDRGHERLPSDSLVPRDDPTLLFTGAGMNQFKDMFLGRGSLPWKRVTTSQKCLRVPDLDNVGLTAGHHTFFEMLGNFSFGDYFKKDCIDWVFGWFTEGLGIPGDRLVVSIYTDDDEAARVWRDHVPEERIYRFGAKENFWPAEAPSQGPNGPCGPCSEIYYDGDPAVPLPAHDNLAELPGRFLEIGNCVFTQFDRQEDGSLPPLPQKNIDVGLGLERITAVLQGVVSNFETDIFAPYIDEVARRAGKSYGADAAADVHMRRIADHIRAVSHCIADGALPGNEGRGYVVRKILRRACRDGYELGITEPFLHGLSRVVVERMGEAYPGLTDAGRQIEALLLQEEQAFRQIYVRGAERFEQWFATLGSPAGWAGIEVPERGRIPVPPDSGTVAFELHDTYGFPADITRQLLLDRGYGLDEAGFQAAMDAQRSRARRGSALAAEVFADGALARLKEGRLPATEFTGYDRTLDRGRVLAILHGEAVVDRAAAGRVEVVFDRTPAYAESGGQVGDSGDLVGPEGRARFVDVQDRDGFRLHEAEILDGAFAVGDEVEIRVDEALRRATERNHTATHLLHRALKNVLGPHVGQAGSLVAPDRLRFDFTHGDRLTAEQVAAVEEEVTREILAATDVVPRWMPLDEARAAGFVAMFGEKYGASVRTLSIGTYSRELCGGTHVRNTGNIGMFRILSDASVAAGVRRIEAVTGFAALHVAQREAAALDALAAALKAPRDDLQARVAALQHEVRGLRKDLERSRASLAGDALTGLEAQIAERGDARVLAAVVDGAGHRDLLDLLDRLRKKHASFAGVLFGKGQDGIHVVAAVTKDLVGAGLRAGDLVRDATRTLGGGGGGRPEMAQGKGKDAGRLEDALAQAWEGLTR